MPDFDSGQYKALADQIRQKYPAYNDSKWTDQYLVDTVAQHRPDVLKEFQAAKPAAPNAPAAAPQSNVTADKFGRVNVSPEDAAKFKKAAQGEMRLPTMSQVAEAIPTGITIGTGLATGGLPLLSRAGVAALAGSGGEGIRQVARGMIDGDPNGPKTPSDRLSAAAQAGGVNALFELGGSAASGAIRGPFRAKNVPQQQMTTAGPYPSAAPITDAEVARANNEWGLGLTPGEANPGSWSARFLQWVGDKSPVGAIIAKNSQTRGVANAARATDSQGAALLNAVPAGPQASGRMALQAVEGGRNAFARQGKLLYDDLTNTAQGVMVDMRPFKAEVGRQYQQMFGAVDRATGNSLNQSPTAQKLLSFLNGPDQMTFSDAHSVQQFLGKIGRDTTDVIAPDMAAKVLGASKETLENSMESAAVNSGKPDVMAKWQKARDFWKEGMDTFERSSVNGFANGNTPEHAFALVRPGEKTSVEHAKKAILDYADQFGSAQEKQQAKEAWNAYREQWLRQHVIGDAERQGTSLESLVRMKDRIEKWGPGVLDTMFNDASGKVAIKNLRTIADAMSRMEKARTSNVGYYTTLKLIGPAAVGTAGYAHGGAPELIGLIAIPGFMSAVVHTPAMTRYLTEGLKSVKSDPGAAVAATTRLAKWFYETSGNEQAKQIAEQTSYEAPPETKQYKVVNPPSGNKYRNMAEQPPAPPAAQPAAPVNKYRSMAQ